MWIRKLKGTDDVTRLECWLLKNKLLSKEARQQFIDFTMRKDEQPEPPLFSLLLKRDLEIGYGC